jgi:16S rRNA (adenine1518-N6/adenine1519-N6)-dimethyltransferase
MTKRKIGQNFLIDRRIAEREIGYADIKKDDVVLEIGPGKGIITKLLAEKAQKVIAIEIDENLVREFNGNLPDNVLLISGDALKVDFKTLPKFNKIVSNLPYHISSPITFKLLDCDFILAVLIYQKEFAERMVAKLGSKDYSRLSVGVYYKSLCKIVETIPKTCFYPQPKVDSCVVRLFPRTSPPFSVLDVTFFFDLTRELFNHRRKRIKTTIREVYSIENINMPYQNMRVEKILPEQIGELSNFLFELNGLKT